MRANTFLCFSSKEFHRKGIGKQLFDYSQYDCPANEITVNSSTYAIRFYESLGFENKRQATNKRNQLYSDETHIEQIKKKILPLDSSSRSPNLIVNYTFEYVFLIKIVSTFATVMVKYIFCILFGIFLIWGCNLVPDKELQEFRTEAGTTTIQSHNKSQSYRSKAVVKQSGKENNSFQEGNMMENMIATLPMVF